MSKTSSEDFEVRKAILAQFVLFDDTFFEFAMRDPKACQEVLRVIMQDPKLTVTEVITQKSIRNLHGRSVQLDAHCILGNGSFCNIEVQKENKDNQLRRCRYNAACVTANITDPGDRFQHVKDVYVVYISRFDIFKKGKTIYHVGACAKETGEFVNDGLHEIFVNGKNDDGSDIAELMKCFDQKMVDNPKFPMLSQRVRQVKTDPKEVGEMCKLMDDYGKANYNQGVEQVASKMIRRGISDEDIHDMTDLPMKRIKELRDIEMCMA